ncbi:hypothetical protein [uncultured Kordia sp.]|uniref:hypothetical protein n=1 Tax=uncultured Kordia sp. TaxID=507699 RepID=UPI00262880D6|nr:hypothetical protein [uncultured Kordia sp.]
MRFNNAKSKKWIPFLYFFLGVGSIVVMLYFTFFQDEFNQAKLWYVIPIFLVLILGMVYSTAKYFEFDSDGNVLTFVNKGLFISNFINYREQRAEFPKEKLKRYRIQNYIFFCKLYIYIKSRSNKTKRLQFNISLLSGKKRRALRQSLDKVLKHNNAVS